MIRRGFWVAVGAAGGIMAYRRAAQVAKRGWARETVRFTRDVRTGMDLYMSRHPGRVGPTLGANPVAVRGDDPPEPPGRAPDGGTRHRIGRAHHDEKDDHDAVG
jgi:hypothetical protein